MATSVNAVLAQRLKTLQERHNFNPQGTAAQIRGRPHLQAPFAVFQEILSLNKKCALGLTIPYDPEGLDPLARDQEVKDRDTYVYFAHLLENTSKWKCGRSHQPYKRGRQLQTGNHETIVVRHCILVGPREVSVVEERKVLVYLRNHHKIIRGEWFDMSPTGVKNLTRDVRKRLQ